MVPSKRFHLGSVAKSICGDNAVAIPKARYSLEAISPNCCIKVGSKEAAIPKVPGHIEMVPPAPALNSADESIPFLGSELELIGIPKSRASAKACALLFHCAAVEGVSISVINTCLKWSSFKNFFCSSDRSLATAPLSPKGFPL